MVVDLAWLFLCLVLLSNCGFRFSGMSMCTLLMSTRPARAIHIRRTSLRVINPLGARISGTHNWRTTTVKSRIDNHLSDLCSRIEELSLKRRSERSPPTFLSPVWLPRLESLKRPEARSLILELTAENSLGFVPANGQAPGKSSLSYYVMQQKCLHPAKVLLVRVGEFYEAYGVDALMLMEHCGLNPMGEYSSI
mmetsp:Transcript_27161/g.45877  ORF Transcript_27161/g.45877 Transcript_27161/m.45877 type:complete len:194 (-) Transcript_27161:287-868(-)